MLQDGFLMVKSGANFHYFQKKLIWLEFERYMQDSYVQRAAK